MTHDLANPLILSIGNEPSHLRKSIGKNWNDKEKNETKNKCERELKNIIRCWKKREKIKKSYRNDFLCFSAKEILNKKIFRLRKRLENILNISFRLEHWGLSFIGPHLAIFYPNCFSCPSCGCSLSIFCVIRCPSRSVSVFKHFDFQSRNINFNKKTFLSKFTNFSG